MKPVILNLSFIACLAGGIQANAQQAVLAPVAPLRTADMATPVAPAQLATTVYGRNDYYYSDKQINDADLKSKEVSKEISMPKGADIYIENTTRSLVIKTWDQPKVKVTTTVYFEGESKLTDEEWLERVNLSLKTLGSSVKIKSGTIGSNGGFYAYNSSGTYSISGSGGGNVAIFNDRGQSIGTKTGIKRIVTITVPAGSKLDVESKYADVQLPANIGDVSVDISNGNLEAENINKLVLRSKYSNANVGDVKIAELEFSNGRFSAKTIDDLDVDSKYSTIEMAAAKKLVFRSTNDEYEIEEAGEVRGRKNYGNLRITRLNNSLEVDGANADVKVRNIGPSLTLIKLDNRYADVRIPLRSVKDYSVDFTGSYSSVYGNFDKTPVSVAEKTDRVVSGSSNTIAPTAPATSVGGGDVVVVSGRLIPTRSSNWGDNTPSRFTATVGSGKGLKIEMKCQNCTVDFK